jgi:hypothetical protein
LAKAAAEQAANNSASQYCAQRRRIKAGAAAPCAYLPKLRGVMGSQSWAPAGSMVSNMFLSVLMFQWFTMQLPSWDPCANCQQTSIHTSSWQMCGPPGCSSCCQVLHKHREVLTVKLKVLEVLGDFSLTASLLLLLLLSLVPSTA